MKYRVTITGYHDGVITNIVYAKKVKQKNVDIVMNRAIIDTVFKLSPIGNKVYYLEDMGIALVVHRQPGIAYLIKKETR